MKENVVLSLEEPTKTRGKGFVKIPPALGTYPPDVSTLCERFKRISGLRSRRTWAGRSHMDSRIHIKSRISPISSSSQAGHHGTVV